MAWDRIRGLLKEELVQSVDEGRPVSDALRSRIAGAVAGSATRSGIEDGAAAAAADAEAEAEMEDLLDELTSLPVDPELAAREPDDLAAIQALRPAGPRDLAWHPDAEELRDRLHGAWANRCAGCALGKPVEGVGLGRDADGRLDGRKRIRAYLEARAEWPLADYFSERPAAGCELRLGCSEALREHIAYMPADDDINYSLLGLLVLERRGPDFDWHDVARAWRAHLPVAAICTAERQAFLTYVAGEPYTAAELEVLPARTRAHRNPYREWIGAQIRADPWAWACAGKPELAAAFAYRDACWTHSRNGIYGAMFVASMIAAAAVERDPQRLIDIGLSEIPRDCRLARWVATARDWFGECRDFHAFMDRLEAELGCMHVVHTINNALVVIASLYYGRLDPLDSVLLSVMGGLDTDCNGATVGSITGMAHGRSALPGRLVDRLGDSVRPALVGVAAERLTELAERSARQWERVAERPRQAINSAATR